MPDWVIWVAIAVFLMNCRGGCRLGANRIRGHRERMRDRMTDGDMTRTQSHPRLASGREEWLGGNPQPRSRNAEVKTTRRETPLAVLQRKFVSGPMSLEQYEAELDKLDRLE
ncbi:MAG: hypothetical protein V3W24_03900 [Gemmatimonadota bacterium]